MPQSCLDDIKLGYQLRILVSNNPEFEGWEKIYVFVTKIKGKENEVVEGFTINTYRLEEQLEFINNWRMVQFKKENILEIPLSWSFYESFVKKLIQLVEKSTSNTLFFSKILEKL